MMTLITKIKRRFDEFDYRVIPDDEWTYDSEVAWDSQSIRILIPARTYRGGNAGNPRDMMTIMHEVAHALLGHKGVLHRAPTGNRAEKFSEHIRTLEWEARRYAAAFLMPDTEWTRSASPEAIARRYNVSLEAANIRKREIGRK